MNFADAHFVSEMEMRIPGVVARIGECRWTGPFEVTFDAHTTHIACAFLSQRPKGTTGYYSYSGVTGTHGTVGHFTFAPAGVEMFHRSPGTPARILRCDIEPSYLAETTDLKREWSKPELAACLDMRSRPVLETTSRIVREMESPGFASTVLLESYATALLIEVTRHLQSTHRRNEVIRQRLAPWQLRRIDTYLNEFEGEAPTLATLAAQCRVSRSHLNRLFKATTGTTLYNHIIDTRIARAKAYLLGTDIPLKAISSRLGFSQPAAFSSAFRKSVGETPKDFRQRHKK